MAEAARVILVHTLEHACAALEAACDTSLRVTLQSAPAAACYAGSLYLLTLFQKAQARFPAAQARFILDCGEAGAEAVEAMRMGHRAIRSSAPPELAEKLADIARQLGCEIATGEYSALDPLRRENGREPLKDACKKWLLGLE